MEKEERDEEEQVAGIVNSIFQWCERDQIPGVEVVLTGLPDYPYLWPIEFAQVPSKYHQIGRRWST